MQFCKSKTLYIAFISILSFFVFTFVSADDPGVIDTSATNQAKVCHNVACDDFGIINFELELQPSISVNSSTGISGKVWGDELGWINFAPTGGGVTFADSDTGVLTGYAWSQVSGWINFAPTGEGVTINPDTGEFEGYAWSGGAYGGWIKFDCNDSSTCVRTTWRASSGGGGGSCGKNCNEPSQCEYPFTLIDGACVCQPPLVDIGGWCAYDDTFPDICPNIPYLQLVVPIGMTLDSNGNCLNNTNTDTGGGGSNPGDPPDDIVDPTDPAVDPIGPIDPDPIDPIDPTDPVNPIRNGDVTVIGFIEDLFNSFNVDFFGFIDKLGFLIRSPQGELITNILSGIGLISGIVITLFSGIFSFSEIGLNLLRLWSFFLYGMGFKKRNRPWGTVYDSITKQPLDPAYVSLNDLSGKEVASSITDLDGRYGFLVEPGTYKISASKTNYVFPSVKLTGKNSDELYNDLYFGENITVTEDNQVIAKNIPLDRLNFDWNEFAKKEQHRMKFYHARDLLFSRFADFMFFLGFIVSIIVLFIAPKPYNIIIFCLYIVLLLIRRTTIRRNRKGRVYYEATKIPLSFGILRVKSMVSGQEVAHRVLDKTGNYYCLVPNGIYNASIEKKNEDSSYTTIFVSNNFEIKNGLLKKDFKI